MKNLVPELANVRHARLVFTHGHILVLKDLAIGEQRKGKNGKWEKTINPLEHNHFRVRLTRGGAIDIKVHNFEGLRRLSGGVCEVISSRITHTGTPNAWGGRLALSGQDHKGETYYIAFDDLKRLEISNPVAVAEKASPLGHVEGAGNAGVAGSGREQNTGGTPAAAPAHVDNQEAQIQTGDSTMAVRPTEDRVLVKPIEAESKTASGLYLPETAKEKPVRGEVIATGPGKRLDNGQRAQLSVGVGDTVVYGKYAGTEVEIKGVKHLIMRESELLGVIEG